MTPPNPPNDGQNQGNYPGGYGPPPESDPNLGGAAGPYPGQQPPPGMQPQQPYGPQGQYYQQGPGGSPSSDDNTMGLLIHLGGILFGFVVPLVFYLVKKDESAWIRHHSIQAFNFQMLILIGWVASWVLSIVLIGVLLMPLVFIVNIIFCILAGMAANKGEWYTYPVTIPMLK